MSCFRGEVLEPRPLKRRRVDKPASTAYLALLWRLERVESMWVWRLDKVWWRMICGELGGRGGEDWSELRIFICFLGEVEENAQGF